MGLSEQFRPDDDAPAVVERVQYLVGTDLAGVDDEWRVTDDTFDTGGALYTANQDIWIGNWGGDFYAGRGVPGKTDEPP